MLIKLIPCICILFHLVKSSIEYTKYFNSRVKTIKKWCNRNMHNGKIVKLWKKYWTSNFWLYGVRFNHHNFLCLIGNSVARFLNIGFEPCAIAFKKGLSISVRMYIYFTLQIIVQKKIKIQLSFPWIFKRKMANIWASLLVNPK